MKVILLRDVARIGKKGSLVEVQDGYARNQLIPSRSAEAATPQSIKRFNNTMAAKEAGKAAEEEKFFELKKELGATEVAVAVEANEKGHLFKAVSMEEIAKAAEAAGVKMSADSLSTGDPIKSLGEHQVHVNHGQDSFQFTVIVKSNK